MSEFSIRRLILVTGPSAVGKSSFLKDPLSFLGSGQLPLGFQDLVDTFEDFKLINEYTPPSAGARLDTLCMHIDLSHPLRELKVQPNSRDALFDLLNADLFQSWEELLKYMDCAEEVQVVTLFVKRPEHFRRFVYGRKMAIGIEKIKTALVAWLGDSEHGSILHRRYYSAWLQFLQQFSHVQHTVIDANGKKYSIHSDHWLREQLARAY